MRSLTSFMGFISVVAGLILLGYAILSMPIETPSTLVVQATYAVTKASFFALLGIGALLLALVCVVSLGQRRPSENSAPRPESSESGTTMGSRLGKL